MLALAEGGTGFLPQPREPGTRPAAGPPGRFFTRFLLNCKYLSRRTHPNLISCRQASRLSQRRSREKGPLQGPSWREAVASFLVSALGCVCWGDTFAGEFAALWGDKTEKGCPVARRSCLFACLRSPTRSEAPWGPGFLSSSRHYVLSPIAGLGTQ